MDASVRGAGNPGGASHRRRITASIYGVAADGATTRVPSPELHGSVTSARPSPLGAGLFDVTFDTGINDALPVGARQIWERWRSGHPAERNQWASYDRDLRHQWAGAALSHHRYGEPDRSAGATYHLDGQHVTDVEGFYCAIGEAVNGPDGYFGWNLDALHDCLCGRWGASTPFRLVWHDAAVAKANMIAGYDRRRWAPATTMDALLRLLAEYRVDVQLR
jgi:RNAse (barnase) inhibitor barstar